MPNRWVEFVKKWASKNNLSYGCAISKPECKAAYKKEYPPKSQEFFREAKERYGMGEEDYDIKEIKEKVDFNKLTNLLDKIKPESEYGAKHLELYKKSFLDNLHKKFKANEFNEKDDDKYVALLDKFRKKQLQNFKWSKNIK